MMSYVWPRQSLEMHVGNGFMDVLTSAHDEFRTQAAHSLHDPEKQ